MSFLAGVMLAVSYGMMAILTWLVFACWLHDTKKEFNHSWTMPVFLGLVLGFVWPISLMMLVFYENSATSCQNNDKS